MSNPNPHNRPMRPPKRAGMRCVYVRYHQQHGYVLEARYEPIGKGEENSRLGPVNVSAQEARPVKAPRGALAAELRSRQGRFEL